MNLRIRDNLVYWSHRGLAATGRIRAPTLDEIRREGFQRVLVAATTAIGDAVLCTPLLASLRAAHPRAHIGFWVPLAAEPLFRGDPGLNRVLGYRGKYRTVRSILQALRDERFDLALVANANDPDVIPLIWWSGCRRIIRRPQRNTIFPFMVANPEMLSASHTTGHAIERNLQFCDLLGFPRGEARTRLVIPPEVAERMRAVVGKVPAPWWCVHPGSSRPKKQWPTARFAELARRILERAGGTVILTGSRSEEAACAEVQREAGAGDRIRNLAGALQLDGLAALFRETRLLVSGDTGPYHIAMAVNAPTVTLFAPWDIGSSPSINGPSFDLERHRVVETARIGDLISTITTDRVFEACQPFLK
jgi:ADP-heptose:LPS heptosyltransferase